MAALEEGKTVRERPLDPQQRTAQSLAPAIAALLGELDWPPDSLDAVAVTTGPGSFTGLRIGVTTAKTLAYATAAAVIGISTLEVIAAQSPHEARNVWSIMDAQRGDLFVGQFVRADDGRLQWARQTEVMSSESWRETVAAGEMVTGPGLRRLDAPLPAGVAPAPAEAWDPRAGTVALLAGNRFRQGQVDDVWALVPCYYRRSAAEEKWLRRRRERPE